ncbi:hypothetical protein D3C78_1195410 [compost metagenome]
MCTHRLNALDPAVKRRAAEVLSFGRPNDEQRRSIITNRLGQLGIPQSALDDLVKATGPQEGNIPGYTFSDLTRRLIPSIVLDAYPTQAVNPLRAVRVAQQMNPTPAFQDHQP